MYVKCVSRNTTKRYIGVSPQKNRNQPRKSRTTTKFQAPPSRDTMARLVSARLDIRRETELRADPAVKTGRSLTRHCLFADGNTAKTTDKTSIQPSDARPCPDREVLGPKPTLKSWKINQVQVNGRALRRPKRLSNAAHVHWRPRNE